MWASQAANDNDNDNQHVIDAVPGVHRGMPLALVSRRLARRVRNIALRFSLPL
jgi:hypothetical protein